MVQKLLTYMEEHHLDAFYVSKPENVRYISRYTGEDSYLLVTKARKFFITDPRYTEQASYECPDYEIINWKDFGKTMGETIAALLGKTDCKNLAFEAEVVTYNKYRDLEDRLKVELVPQVDVVETFRSVKSKEEIEKLRISADIASRAFEKIIKDIRVGVTEKELASKLAHYMVMEGADTKPYGGILISGARTSLLHGIPSSKAIEYGDLVLMDYGCQYKGYLSDMTRTVVVGRATPKQREVYALEQQMVADCEAVMKAGATGAEVYEASTRAIKGTEYFDYHYTGIGHGIGMFVHEIPFMAPASKAVFEPGNVITVEPGIYIPGWGGIRIEDEVLITENGCENLISATKELIEL